MRELMSIGEFSELSGLSSTRLRSYGEAGVLAPAAVDPETGYRYYSPDQLADAQLIDALRRAGMALSDVKLTLRDRSLTRLGQLARQIGADADARRQATAQARDLLMAHEANPLNAEELPTPMSIQLSTAGRTETGTVRETNEDVIVVTDRLLAVADGMGGHQAGEIASALAAAATAAVFTGRSLDELEASLRAANWAVWQRATQVPDQQGMGTTLCAVGVLDDETIALANVGDSRVYLSREGTLRQLTRDDTVAAELVRQGRLAPADAAGHPHRRLLTRALGVAPGVAIEMSCLRLLDGDRLLLCSDGAYDGVPEANLAEVLASAVSPQAVVDGVLDLALADGGDDNASAVAAFVSHS